MKTPTKKFRMFHHPLLELLSRSHPALMIPFHLLLIMLSLTMGFHVVSSHPSVLPWLTFLFGFLSWTLAEYLLHRYLFHWIDEDSPWLRTFHFALHGYHHEHPDDANRLFMPPVPATLFLLLFLAVFYLILGYWAWFFLPGFELGYLLYALVHYSVHTRKAPAGLKFLWKHHALHHYRYPDKAFGVSTRLWDRIFGTMPPAKKAPGLDVHVK